MRGLLAERLGVGVQEKYYATSTGGTPTDRTAAHPTAKPLPRGTEPVPRCHRVVSVSTDRGPVSTPAAGPY